MVTTTNFEENAFKLCLITVLKWIMFSIHMSTFTISIHGIFFSTSSSQSNLSASIYIPRRRRPDHLTKSPRERNAEIDRSSHNHTHGWIVVEKSDDPLGKWNPNRNVAFSRVIFTDRQSLLANPIKKNSMLKKSETSSSSSFFADNCRWSPQSKWFGVVALWLPFPIRLSNFESEITPPPCQVCTTTQQLELTNQQHHPASAGRAPFYHVVRVPMVPITTIIIISSSKWWWDPTEWPRWHVRKS